MIIHNFATTPFLFRSLSFAQLTKVNRKKFQNSLKTLDYGFGDAFAYLANDVIHSRLRSTNCLRRLYKEVRRREKVVRIFPNEDSDIRLIAAILIDIN